MSIFVKIYVKFLLKTLKPSKTWKVTRFVLHWLTLPLKLLVIGSLGGYQILKNSLFAKNRMVPEMPTTEEKQAAFKKIWDRLPVWRNNNFHVYAPRVPYPQPPNGHNHSSDHQCSRQGTYQFIVNQLGQPSEGIIAGTMAHIQPPWLLRGFNYNAYEDTMDYNAGTVSGDMLTGLSLAISELSANNAEVTDPEQNIFVGMTGNMYVLRERFDELMMYVVEHDYALIEGASPEKGDYGYELWKELYEKESGNLARIRMKSERGMWQPGLETVGAQALTILAALRVADKKIRSPEAGKQYRKLLWKYGYGLLSLFPTAFISSKRGYFNDHNCMVNLYVLSRLADTKIGRLYWKACMLYVWALSKHWYNPYFTGLLEKAHPGTVSEEYRNKCIAYLYNKEMPRDYGFRTKVVGKSKLVPVPYNKLDEDEFSPDIEQDQEVHVDLESERWRSGLGFLASAVMIEKDPKFLLNKK